MSFLRRHKELFLEFGTSLLLIISGGLGLWIFLKDIKSPLILHFSSYTGINQIGDIADLMILTLSGVIVICMNAGISWALESRMPSLARVVGLSTLFLSALLFIGFMAIISVNS